MSQLTTVFLLALALVALAYTHPPKAPVRCCADPGHRASDWRTEASFCPIRDR
jgi:hypothetical protein